MALSRLTSIDTFRSRVIRDGSSRTRPPVPEINRHVCELYVRVSSRRLGASSPVRRGAPCSAQRRPTCRRHLVDPVPVNVTRSIPLPVKRGVGEGRRGPRRSPPADYDWTILPQLSSARSSSVIVALFLLRSRFLLGAGATVQHPTRLVPAALWGYATRRKASSWNRHDLVPTSSVHIPPLELGL